jgi:hypothetical protein
MSTDTAPIPDSVSAFGFTEGLQGYESPISALPAIAVHDGDVLGDGVVLPDGPSPTPIPGAILLFAPGLVALAAIRRRFKK